ncbi:hypothetical protein L905_15040 [Agrobacterium sp. TS43]|nr:hypothetical protein L902_02620 [Agrobacterium radiobacter DSM 30147]KVK45523.1 hypothetical protein L904_25285 [Agrobacterium sp. LY4]KVK45625.1 hypothetical protein L903_25540 [Agrobacterium sp. JL28]KVK59085.1 hypothetical protein L906_25450 [Agrobacterium sp. TS45]KVK63486.1 hypothetical protein L907_25065 [Agrobacterium sp. C13]KVK68297.1 hypothetical protein L905_15040 [Agrobacterium sp. TS43]
METPCDPKDARRFLLRQSDGCFKRRYGLYVIHFGLP